ncbi:unnamed protein product, partial [Brenthis ino]
MSEGAILDSPKNHKEEDSKNIKTLLQSSDQNLKQTVERQVTICDVEEVNMIQETSFKNNDEDVQLSTEKVKENHSSSELEDHIINTVNSTQHIAEENNASIENGQNINRRKCQCFLDVFECTIWALRSMAYSISSFFRRNCCCYCARKVDLSKREINDDGDGECWDGNVMDNEGDYCTYNLNNDDTNERKAIFHLNEAFDEGISQTPKDHCNISKKIVDDTETSHSIDKNEACIENHRSDIDFENSASNAVCHVNIHHEAHGNNSLVNSSGGHDISGGDRGGHDFSGGDSGGHDFSGGGGGGCDFSSD